jgi:hypothetical protein
MWGLLNYFEAFRRHLIKSEAFSKITWVFEGIFNKIVAFLKWSEAFSKNSRLNWRFFHFDILKDFEAF